MGRRPGSRSCASRSSTASTPSASARRGLAGSRRCLDVKILDYPDPRGVAAGGDHPELRGDPPRTLHAGWHRTGDAAGSEPRRLAGGGLGTGANRQAREPRHGHSRRDPRLEARRAAAPLGTNADGPRRRAQAHCRSRGSGTALPARSRLHEPVHLLRRSGRSGPGRDCRARRPDDRHAHGQVHRDDARATRGCSG